MIKYDIDLLIKDYSKTIYNLAFRITGNKQDAEDITQETFIEVYKGLNNFRGESKISTWIYKIALNLSLKAKKKYNKSLIESIEQKIDEYKENIPSEIHEWHNDPEKSFLYEDLINQIRNKCHYVIIFLLPDNQRIVFILRIILNFSYKEISEILNVSENIIKARLNRARNNLMNYFNNNCQCFNKSNKCNCTTKIGYELANNPKLIEEIKLRINRKDYYEIAANIINKNEDIDSLYKSLPMLEYKTIPFKKFLKKINN